jgi:hypothetical protein
MLEVPIESAIEDEHWLRATDPLSANKLDLANFVLGLAVELLEKKQATEQSDAKVTGSKVGKQLAAYKKQIEVQAEERAKRKVEEELKKRATLPQTSPMTGSALCVEPSVNLLFLDRQQQQQHQQPMELDDDQSGQEQPLSSSMGDDVEAIFDENVQKEIERQTREYGCSICHTRGHYYTNCPKGTDEQIEAIKKEKQTKKKPKKKRKINVL